MQQQILNQLIRLIEKSFIVLGLTFFSGAFGTYSLGIVVPSFVIGLIKFFVWGTSTFLILILWKNTLITIRRNLLLFLLTALACLSFMWSQVPYFTLNISTDILYMTFFGLYFAIRFSLKEIVELVALTLFIGGIISTICAIGMPRIAVHIGDVHAGAWKGIYNYKNQLGSIMNLMCVSFFALPKDNLKIYKYSGIMFSILLILLSTSKTSLVVFLLLISTIIFYKNFRWKGKISVILLDIGILILGCFTVVIVTYWVEILTELGRDATLTGRTPIWGVMIVRLMQRPFLGYGIGAYFSPKSPYAFEAGQALKTGWIPPSGHNGFLDLAVDIGLIGLGLFIIIYLTSFIRALKLAYASKNSEDIFPLVYLIMLATNNITESLLLYESNIYWVLFVTITFVLNQNSSVTDENYVSEEYSYINNDVNEKSLLRN
jgi:O-antigen ligase